MKRVKDEFRKEIALIKLNQLKPNFAELARKYDMDYRTVKKYYEGYDGKPAHHNKKSKLDQFEEVIREKMSYVGAKASAVYFFLTSELDYDGSYSNFTYYLRKHEISSSNKAKNVHVRYETPLGEQLQFDWVEDITMVNKFGETFKFNVFSAELSYSRLHFFCYSVHKTREDVLECLVKTFKFMGGVTKGILTDNMSSIVNTNKLKFCSEFNAFAKDFDIETYKCKVRSPETKGKVEVRNQFMKWLIPYNFEFETEDDIIKIIEKINVAVNNKINSTTNMKPILLYAKEKEYLKPLPSSQIIEHYLNLTKSATVSNASLVYYKGNQYSVPPKFINKTLKVKEMDNKLYIYDNTDLVTTHDISTKKINYKEDHYALGLKESMPDKSDEFIENLAKRNLDIMDEIANI